MAPDSSINGGLAGLYRSYPTETRHAYCSLRAGSRAALVCRLVLVSLAYTVMQR